CRASQAEWRQRRQRHSRLVLSRTLLAGKKRPNLWDKFGGDRHQRDVLRLTRRLDVGEFLVLCLVLVMRDQLLDAFLIPSGWKLLLLHSGFLCCRWRHRTGTIWITG